MKTKPDIKKIIENIKQTQKKIEKIDRNPMRIDIDYTKPYRQRDMRQDAMDMDAHEAKEYFGGQDDQGM